MIKNKKTTKKIKLAHPKHSVLRHFRLIESKHAFKLVHHRHTAHFPLVLILLLIGVLIFSNPGYAFAQEITKSGSVTIGMVVPGEPPSVGAEILIPLDKSKQVGSDINVSGSCAPDTFVVVYNNGDISGTVVCSDEGVFSIKIQLNVGDNVLQAKNFDAFNQSGPETNVVTVTIEQPKTDELVVPPVIAKPTPDKDLDNPIIIPPINPTPSTVKSLCSDYKGEIDTSLGGPVVVSVVCVVRGLQLGQQSSIGLLVHGGQPPYAVSVDLGEDQSSSENSVLVSVPQPAYKSVPVTYAKPGQYTVKVKAKDKVGQTAITQTVIEVNGVVGLNNFASIQETVFNTSWLQTSVPAYLLVLVLTLGFWFGDIFDRRFGDKKPTRRRFKAA